MSTRRLFLNLVAEIFKRPDFQKICLRGKSYQLDFRRIPSYDGKRQAVMLHIPGSMSPWNWASIFPFFCSYLLGYESIVISPLGEGWSSKIPPSAYQNKLYPRLIAWLYLQFLNNLDIRKAILVAHSTFSTQVITEMEILASKFGIEVEALVFQAPAGLKKLWNPLGLLLRFSLSGSLVRWLNAKVPGPIEFFQQFFPQPIALPENQGSWHVMKMWREVATSGDGSFPKRLKLVRCKVFALFPRYDFVHPVRSPFGKNRIDILKECISADRLFIAVLPKSLHNSTLFGDAMDSALILGSLFREANL